MGDGGALALRSARQEQHGGAGAGPAGAAARSRAERAERSTVPPPGPSLAPWLHDAQEPAPGDNQELLPGWISRVYWGHLTPKSAASVCGSLVRPLIQFRLGTKTQERKIPRLISSQVKRMTKFSSSRYKM